MILSAEPLLDVIPIMRREADGAIITQFDMGACETLGLLKMDFLGLRNLTIIDDALRHIEANGKTPWSIEDLELDDPATYELLARGDTLGVFQLDGGPMRALLRRHGPDELRGHLRRAARSTGPGPMGANAHNDYADRKNGRQEVTPIHPELAEPLAEILGETYGLIVYQEQVMAIAQKLAGYSLGKADLLRRAMGKKKKEILDKEYVAFADGHARQRLLRGRHQDALGHPGPVLRLRVQQGAHRRRTGSSPTGPPTSRPTTRPSTWPRCSPSSRDDKDKSAIYLDECRRMGIKVLPPGRQRVGARLRARSAPTSASAWRRSATSGANVVDSIVAARAGEGRASPTSPTSCARSTRSSATRGSSSR